MASTSKDEFVETDHAGIWQYYLREKKRGQKAMCKECSVIVKCEGGSTSGLHTHQRTKHNNNTLKRSTPEDAKKKRTKTSKN